MCVLNSASKCVITFVVVFTKMCSSMSIVPDFQLKPDTNALYMKVTYVQAVQLCVVVLTEAVCIVCEVLAEAEERVEYRGQCVVCEVLAEAEDRVEYRGQCVVCEVLAEAEDRVEYRGQCVVCEVLAEAEDRVEYRGQCVVCEVLAEAEEN